MGFYLRKIFWIGDGENAMWTSVDYLKIALYLQILHFILVLQQVNTYLSLLYGPLLFFAICKMRLTTLPRRTLVLHLLPFIGFSTLFLFVDLFKNITLILVSNIVSFAAYACYIRANKSKLKVGENDSWVGFYTVILLLAVFLLSLVVVEYNLDYAFSFGPKYIIAGLILIAIFITTSNIVFFDGRFSSKVEAEQHIEIEGEHRDLILKIEAFFTESKLYLDSQFGLERMAQEIGVPKQEISLVINRGLNKNFYILLAEYRIEYAKTKLISTRNLYTIESVIYECGFNSKSSFHRYFKQFVGCTPSEFRQQYQEQLEN